MAKVYDNATDLVTFARSSSGTALRRVGYGDELLVDGSSNWIGDFDVAADLNGWTDVSTGTGSATWSSGAGAVEIYRLNGGNIGSIYKDISCSIGDVFRISVERISGSGVALRVGSTSGNNQLYDSVLGSGVSTIYVVATTTTLSVGLRGGLNASTTNIDNISAREVFFDRATDPLVLLNHPDDTPRIEYGSDGSLKGLLIEEQRTNFLPSSQDLADPFWGPTGIPTPTAISDGPYGLPAFEVTGLDTSGDRLDYTSGAAAQDGDTYTYSCWLKGSGVVRITVNTSTGVGGKNEIPITLTDEWVRHSVTHTFSSPTGNVRVHAVITRVTGAAPTVYIAGPQLEAGSFATSYIPTSGSQQTRSADVASIPVTAFGYNQDAGTVVVEVDSIKAGVSQRLLSINNSANTSGERTDLLNNAGSQNVQHFTVDGGTTQTDHSLSVAGLTSFKIAATIAPDDYSMCVNGGTVVAETDGTPTVPTVDTFRLGGGVSSPLNGHIKSIQYYPRRLTNTQLQELTS